MKGHRPTLIALAIVVTPAVAHANAGTALMWASLFHMAIGNAVIGAAEGLLLSRIFRVSRPTAVLTLIAANYTSAWFGRYVVVDNLAGRIEMTIENVQSTFWTLVLVAFLVTLIVEYPFFLFALRKTSGIVWKSIVAAVLIHCVSYALLFGGYWWVSGTSMMTKLEVVSAKEMGTPADYRLYYIPQNGKEVLRCGMAGQGAEVIGRIEAPHVGDRLFARPTEDQRYDLFLRLYSRDKNEEGELLIQKEFASLAPVDARIERDESDGPMPAWLNFGPVPKIASHGDWEYTIGFWAVEGIRGQSEESNEEFYFALELPFVAWDIRNATHIDGDFVIFQLGRDQICILQPQERKIALIARGRGPIVAKN